MSDESIVFIFVFGCVTVLLALILYLEHLEERGNK